MTDKRLSGRMLRRTTEPGRYLVRQVPIKVVTIFDFQMQ